jgi:D-alanyl-D-alanine carboxypeptidase
MIQNITFFLAAFLFSLPFWLGFNVSSMTENPELLQAQIIILKLQEQILKELPTLKQGISFPELQTQSALSMFIRKDGETKILFEKESNQRLPIASITKLMTALVVAKHYPAAARITISRSAVLEDQDFGQLRIGDVFSAQDLLYPLLMESSNDAATALSEMVGREAFVDLMNLEAHQLGLKNTHFVNPTGLDPANSAGPPNYSTSRDLATLVGYLMSEYPEIFQILSIPQRDLLTLAKTFHHTMKNTNELLSFEGWPTPIVGGKTGWTPLAKGCLILVLQSPKDQGYLVSVVLGAEDRFAQMKTLVNWTYDSFTW